MEQESLRSALRERTRGLHGRLDTALTGPDGRIHDVPGYVRVLGVLHLLHVHADGPLARWAATSPLADGLDRDVLPDRAAAYAADLRRLGAHPSPSSGTPAGPVDDARGLALLYLVAGSAAGARVLLRGLPDVVPADARRGLTDAAGATSTALWRHARTVLARPVSTDVKDAAVAEAETVFALLVDRHQLAAS